ncbi:2'-5' RNA ligase family protein [Novosphingobium sp. FKTRR1]|uniref:2'-5' RNA ligase family protein n=1 Tax=Novosphingobium sp. FKTRR1 TaxID=2879118 RepID=UPI001CF02C5D|nr:2'-5' RNA ligase family protein [Novosphingobium sp. FKTRR1]
MESLPTALPPSAPLIVTATLPAALQGRAEGLRRAHFPPERNHLSAHVTLFHALPGFVFEEARQVLADLCRTRAAPAAQLDGLMDLGGGTALRIRSEAMLDLRADIADRFHGLLTAQDQARPRLHVTVQNKVTRAEAKALQAELATQSWDAPFSFAGLALHHYRGGPWEAAGTWSFRGRG